jgi:8-oxo-dGTP pyrophosphatase MutT (NUDIX family)
VTRAAGILLVEPQGRALLLKRSDDGTWALPGGHIEPSDGSPLFGALRELAEETGYQGIVDVEKSCLDVTVNPSGIRYWTFGGLVKKAFQPKLNFEHVDGGWFHAGALPSPLHPGVQRLFRRLGYG